MQLRAVEAAQSIIALKVGDTSDDGDQFFELPELKMEETMGTHGGTEEQRMR